MYTLIDTFNRTPLSNHRTLANALKAQQKDAKRLRTRSGGYSYVTYAIRRSDDTPITRDEMIEAEIAAGIY
jgi:hypothetical protein